MKLPSLTFLRNKRYASVAIACLGLGGAAVGWASLGPSNTPLQAVARVNGAVISRAAFERVWAETREQSKALEMQENRQVVLDSVVGAELLAQQALKDTQLMADAQLLSAMEMQSRNLLANAYVNEFLKRNPATEAALKTTYEQLVKDLGKKELHLQHVLLGKQEDAEALHGRITRGELSFAKALEQSEEKTPEGKKATGDLGWIAEGRLNTSLRESATALTGAGVLKPYADQYGWHVVQVTEQRPLKVPAIDALRSELIPMAQRSMLRDHIAKIKAQAKIAI